MSMNVDKDTQELIISALIKNSHLYSVCKDQMSDGHFSDPSCKVIYKALSVYYNKYGAVPSINELLVTIDSCYYSTVGVSLSVVKDTCCRLVEYEEPDEEFIKDKIVDFIRKVNSAGALKRFIEKVKLNPNLESDEVLNDLINSLEVSLSTNRVFSMSNIEQVKEARASSVGGTDQSKIIKSFIESINNNLMFGGWQPGTVNMVVSPPGTGKTMYLINEGVNAAKQGFDVLHIFIGDMTEYDGFIRYLSCVSNTSQNALVMTSVEKQMRIIEVCNQQYDNIFNHISLVSYPSLSLTVDALIEDVVKFEKEMNKDFGMIIVDYPDNLILDGTSLYTDGGTLYSSLEKMARLTKAVMLVASQPQKAYWSYELIPLEAAAESSKKQQCVDVMLTMNTHSRSVNFGTMLLAKTRKGNVGKIFRYKTDFISCQIEEINESEYNALVASCKNNT